MGRNLILGNGQHAESFSRAFTEVVWDNALGLFEAPPQTRSVGEEQIISETALRDWYERLAETARKGPILYQIWRSRNHEFLASDVAYAWHQGQAVMIEAAGPGLELRVLDQFPSLDYEPPQWMGAELFEQTFASTQLTLQAERPAEFFAHDLEQLKQLLEHPGDFWVSML